MDSIAPVRHGQTVTGGIRFRSHAPEQPHTSEPAASLDAVLEAIPDGIVVVDGDGTIVTANRHAERLFGWEPGGLVGRSVEELLPRRVGAAHRRHRHRYGSDPAARQMGLGLDLWGRRRDGAEFPVDVSLGPVEDAEGRTLVLATVRDMTERSATARAVAQNERRLREAQAVAGIGSWSYEPTADRIECSEEHLRLLGLPAGSTPTYHDLLALVHPEDREAYLDAALTSLRTGRPASAECRVVRPDGDIRWVHSLGRPELDGTGRIVAFHGTTQDITERKVVELALAESEANLREAQAVAHLASWTWRVDEQHPRWSEEMYRIHGMEPGSAIPDLMGYAERVHPDDRERVLSEFGWTLHRHQPYDLEYRIVRSDGALRWVQARGRTEVTDAGLVHVHGTILDITERKEVELALAESEANLREAQAVGQVGTWAWSPLDDVATLSAQVCLIFGLAPEEAPRDLDAFLAFVHPEDVEDVVDTLDRAWGNAHEFEGDFRVVRPTGETRWLYARGRSQLDARGEQVRLIGTLQDITERHVQEERYRAISELVSDAAYAFVVRDDGEVEAEWITSAFARLVDRPESQDPAALLRRWEQLVHPDDQEVASASFERALAGDEDICEYRLRTPNGDTRWIQAYARPVRDETTGRVTRVYGAARDITEQRRAEEALRRAYEHEHEAAERLRAADRLKDEFLSTASHELRTPLTSIVGFASVLARLRDTIDESTRDEIIDKLERNALELGSMVERLLDFSRLQSGSIDVQRRELVLREVVDQCVDSQMASVLAERWIDVDVPADLRVHADHAGLVHILSNLLTNAGKYSPEDSPVEVRARQQGEECVVSVTDRGVGMDEETRDRMFERFFRGSEQPIGVRGTGIGLAIVHSYVELMGGRIWVESAIGEGSTFSFTVPVAPAPSVPEAPRRPSGRR